MSDFDKLLEQAAKLVLYEMARNKLYSVAGANLDASKNQLDADKKVVTDVLKRRLLGLLEAGQAMRDDYTQTLEEDPCELWDKQKQAAMEGRS